MKQCRACGVLLPSPFFSPISPTLLSPGFQFVKKVLGDLGLVSVGCRPILNFYIPFPLCEFVNQRSYPGIKLLIVV